MMKRTRYNDAATVQTDIQKTVTRLNTIAEKFFKIF
jgi:hypothetical protein